MTTTTEPTGLTLLETIAMPVVEGQVDWSALSAEDFHQVIRGAVQHLDAMEPDEPSDGVLERSVQLEDTARSMVPLQHRYAGLLEDAFNTPKLRHTIGLERGKTPFRDAKDLLAKTHGMRAFEATARVKLARTLTPARATDPDRDREISVGSTKYPRLGALQARGELHPSKLSTAVNMLTDLDDHATTAGKDRDFRNRLQDVVEQDLADKIENTTPEEFSRYASRRKADLIAAMDPPDRHFTNAQTQAMHTMVSNGPVRGNPNAHKWTIITDAEGNEALHTIAALANNPRTKSTDKDEKSAQANEAPESDGTGKTNEVADGRTRGQRAMHALRDIVKFGIANLQHTDLRGANGSHTQLIVLADYPTLMRHLQTQLAELLPEIEESQREKLLQVLAQRQLTDRSRKPNPNQSVEQTKIDSNENPGNDNIVPIWANIDELPIDHKPSDNHHREDRDRVVDFPTAKTTDLAEILNDKNLDRLQPRIGQGIYTQYYPPEILLRLLCDVSVSPVTLTGDRQVLSIGRKQRQFPEAIRRAILARDRGCAVPGCHWPAAWCELHHIKYWSQNGETSTDNGVLLCAHHHQALHAKQLNMERLDGAWHFVQHQQIDPAQQPRRNYFWQN